MANKKKVDKELDKLLQEKKKVDNTTSVKKNTTNKSSNSKKKSTSSTDKKSTYTKKKDSYTNSKKKSTDVSTNTKKKTTSSSTPNVKETIVAPERKKYTKKKEAIVAPERKPKTTPKKPVKKTITVSQKEKEKLKENNPKKEVTELNSRMDQLENEMRNLYEKDQQETRDPIVEVYPTDDDSKVEIIVKQQSATTEEETPYEVGKHEETSVEEKVEESIPVPIEDVSHELETDIAVRSNDDDINTLKKRVSALTVITIILSIIFVSLLIAVIAFIVYVCTY